MISAVGLQLRELRVSVIIPLYNGERYLRQALDSVLNQSFAPFEVIVVNDGSTDGSSGILDTYGKRIVRIDQTNAGTAAARNAGVDASVGGLLAFLDQDDYWVEDKLEKQTSILSKDSDTQIAWGLVQQFVSPELPEEFRRRYRCQEEPVSGYLPSALLIRRKALEKVGPFNARWKIGEWADWYARYKQSGILSENISKIVTYRRIHEGNKGITMAEDRKEYISLIRENLERQRAKK